MMIIKLIMLIITMIKHLNITIINLIVTIIITTTTYG